MQDKCPNRINDRGGGGGMKMFTYIEGGYENFSIGFWEGMKICTFINFIYPPPPSSNYFMTGPLSSEMTKIEPMILA